MRTVLAVLALGAVSRPALADSASESRAVKLVEAGISLLKAGELDGARSAFLKARDLVPDKANPYRFLGLVEARLGHCAEAVSALDAFLTRVPQNDPRTIEAITVRDRCKDDLAPRLGTLAIDSTPPGAEVRLDDETSAARGTTPFHDEAVAAGAHVAFVRKAGFIAASRGVTIAKKETVQLHFDLKPQGDAPAVATLEKSDKASPMNPTVTATTVVKEAVAPAIPGEAITASPPPSAAAPGRRYWIIGIVAGVVAAAAVGVGLGVGLSAREPVFPPVGNP